MKLSGKAARGVSKRLLVLALAANLAACGTIIHPERQNQRASGNLDIGIVLLDGIGLFFFIIPGVIAYAVDFSNHTIYLPGGHRLSSQDGEHKYAEIHIDGKMDQAAIENAIRTETGLTVDMSRQDVKPVKLDSLADLDVQFAQYRAGTRIALAQ